MEKAKQVFQGIYGMMWEKPRIKESSIKKGNTALIIIDMVNGFIREGAMKNELAEEIIEPIVDLMGYFKGNGMPIVAFADCHDENSPEFDRYEKHCIKGTSEAEIVDEIKQAGGYTLINKNSTNGVLEEEFQQWLKDNPEITDFIITGVCTDICVMQFCLTLRALLDKNGVKSRFILPLNMVETYDYRAHQITLINTMAVYFIEQSGAEVCSDLNLLKL
ncbi:MAG: isochorismatase family cysteine hydrolase [Bacillota bacterium]|nr:isochorismatase family cysteine hydrolase [Bacillota bacterium]